LVSFTLAAMVATAAQAAASTESEKNYIAQGDKLLLDDKVNSAIALYKKALSIEPSSSSAHQRLGHALSVSGKLESAIDEEHRALQLDQSNSEAHCNLGWIYGVQQKYRAAIDESRLAIALNPSSAAAYSILGLSLASLENYDLAVSSFEKAIQLDPLDSSYFLNLAAALGRKGDYAKAVTIYQRAINLDRSDASAYVGLGAALGKLGDVTGQVEAYKFAVALAPESPGNHGKLGWALSQIGDWRSAFREGIVANGLRIKNSSSQFFRLFLTTWAAIFVVFGLLFGIIFSGSKFKPQAGESTIRSFFLTFYKDKPGRFVLTNRRLIFVPEAFSQWFGSTRLSIELDQIDKVESRSTIGGGRLLVLLLNGSVYQFNMPNLVLEPVTKELKNIAANEKTSAEQLTNVPESPDAVLAASGHPSFLIIEGEPKLSDDPDKHSQSGAPSDESTIEVSLPAAGDTSADDEQSVIITVVPPASIAAKAEETETEPAKAESAKKESTKPEETEPEPVNPEDTTAKEESTKPAPEETEPPKVEEAKVEEAEEQTPAKVESSGSPESSPESS